MAKKKAYLHQLSQFYKGFNFSPILLWEEGTFRIHSYILSKSSHFHPTIKQIANDLGMGRTTVSKKLSWMEKYRVVKLIRPTKNSIKYELNPPSEWDLERLVADGNIEKRSFLHRAYDEDLDDSVGVRELILYGLDVSIGDSHQVSYCPSSDHDKRKKEEKRILSSKDNSELAKNLETIESPQPKVNPYRNSPSTEELQQEKPHKLVVKRNFKEERRDRHMEKRGIRIKELLKQGLSQDQAEDQVDVELPIEPWMFSA